MENKKDSFLLNYKKHLMLLLLSLLPSVSYGQGQENAVGLAIVFILFAIISLVALSFYVLTRVVYKREGSSWPPKFMFALIMVYGVVYMVIPTAPSVDEQIQKMIMTQWILGLILLVPNVLTLILIPAMGIWGYVRKRRANRKSS